MSRIFFPPFLLQTRARVLFTGGWDREERLAVVGARSLLLLLESAETVATFRCCKLVYLLDFMMIALFGRSHVAWLLLLVLSSPLAAVAEDLESYEEALAAYRGEPPISVQGVDLHCGACLSAKADRLVIEGGTLCTTVAPPAQGGPINVAFLASDLCAMGHSTKDATHLFSWALDFFRGFVGSSDGSPPTLTVVYGNVCMSSSPLKITNQRSPVFHKVLLGWFEAAVVGLRAWARERRIPLVVRTEYYEDLKASHQCFSAIAKRQERWRWFRTREHAALFRAALWSYYNVTDTAAQPPAGSCGNGATTGFPPIVNVTMLRRDEDRHFDEVRVFNDWVTRTRSHPGTGPSVRMQLSTFDNVRGAKGLPPPPYKEQVRLIFRTDALVAAHGAGLASIVAMRPGTAVVELFPQNFRYHMYAELAALIGVEYVAFESPFVQPARCCSGRGSGPATPVIGSPSYVNGVGARACKKCNVAVTQQQWDSILRNAVNFAWREKCRSAASCGVEPPCCSATFD